MPTTVLEEKFLPHLDAGGPQGLEPPVSYPHRRGFQGHSMSGPPGGANVRTLWLCLPGTYKVERKEGLQKMKRRKKEGAV